ncbi:hypothetical protein HOO65_021181 [Ceratocystis lukuohia]|uniref:CCHC-type domain-containing protein n=1 Tax=Ceratocystis lukuohia TaxID=2019550 RepID=A0ABR4MQT1_9PEZI
MDGQFYDTVMTTDYTTTDNSSQTTNATMRPSNPVRLYDHSKPLDYPAFRTILKAQWKYHRSRFPTHEDFIIHCFSHLTGPAAMDIEPWIQDMMAGTETADVEAFFTHLDNTFMDPAAAARALEKVTALQAKMSTPAQAHITQVTQLLRAAGGNGWADSIKMRYLTATLPRKVRDALVTHQETQYTKYAKVVMVVWQRLCEDFPAMAPRHPPPAQHAQAPPDAMDWTPTPVASASSLPNKKRRARWVPPTEMQKRRDNNLCFRCGGGGHNARSCPFLPPIPPAGQPRRATHVNNVLVTGHPVLEEEQEDAIPTEQSGN